ncbi:hypothetical protein [Streptomyces sp. NPDC101149]|uniref:hypothetical protein n=1 Tax=Streptomyces sp. NPDC101149 TaxID=3366113 RepID=UPI00382A0AB0
MTISISPLAMAAKRVIDAAWRQGSNYDLSSQAAFALESAQLLQSPETAAELVAAPTTVYRASHDSIVMGLYTTREAAQQHCEANVRQEEPEGSIRHMSWSADDIGPDAEYELHITPAETGGLIRGTGYVVTPLEVASKYDEGADE